MGTCFSTSVNTSTNSASNSRSLGSGYPTTTTSRAATSGSIASSSTVGSSSYSIETTGESSNGQVILSPILKVFTLAELRAATRNFKPDTLLGEGGFGKVYKAWVDEKTLTPTKSGLGIVVAVKKLTPDSMQGIEEWKSEVDFLGKLSHPNLVKLLGYCIEDRDLLLVYEFMAKGSLENHLFRKSNQQPLSWDLRLRIATDAARGLAFLHSSNSSIIYRDFKASNILLDSDFNAKLSDFGLAKNGPTGEKSHLTTRIMGTYGYAAPEYVATGHLYVQSDVYGFGVVLLEMLSGLRAHDLNRPTGQKNLVDWAKPLLTDKKKITTRLMDSSLDKQYTPKASYLAAQLVLKCIASKPKERPSMDEVVKSLGDIMMQTKDARPPPALHTSRTCSKQAAVRKRQAYPLPNSR